MVKVIHPKSHKDIHSERQYVEVNKPDKTDRQWLAKYKGSSIIRNQNRTNKNIKSENKGTTENLLGMMFSSALRWH